MYPRSERTGRASLWRMSRASKKRLIRAFSAGVRLSASLD